MRKITKQIAVGSIIGVIAGFGIANVTHKDDDVRKVIKSYPCLAKAIEIEQGWNEGPDTWMESADENYVREQEEHWNSETDRWMSECGERMPYWSAKIREAQKWALGN